MARVFGAAAAPLCARIAALGAVLGAANIAAWVWAWAAFRGHPALFGSALLAWGFGLRHAVDADHIAAIDNVTRKLMQEGRRPTAVGFFFSLGHSTIVVLASLAIAAAASAFKLRLALWARLGSVVGTLVSVLFLLAIAAINLVILIDLARGFRRLAGGRSERSEGMDGLPVGGGPCARLLCPLFGLIRTSWHMYPLGFLFGLGFDTATEVGLLGLSAAQATRGLPIWSILVFPALFTAGMSLIDTADGVLMLGAYGWAFVKPIRRLYYNVTITALSIVVALGVGGVEALGLAVDRFGLEGRFWRWIAALSDNLATIGTAIVGLFVVGWIAAAVMYRVRGYDRLDA